MALFGTEESWDVPAAGGYYNPTYSQYQGPSIASGMSSYGMPGSQYSALVPQGAHPMAGTLAMNPGNTDSYASQTNQSPLLSSSALTGGGGQRPASAPQSGAGGYDPNWQSLLTPYNTSNPGAAGDPDAWVRNLDQNTYYKYILPYQQRGGNIRDIAAMQKVIQDGMSAAGGGQWANGSQVNSVAGPKNDYLNNPNAYDNQNRGGVQSTPPTSTGQPTQNGSVQNQPQVDPATAAFGDGRNWGNYGGPNPWQNLGMANSMTNGGSGYERPAFGPPRQGSTGQYSDFFAPPGSMQAFYGGDQGRGYSTPMPGEPGFGSGGPSQLYLEQLFQSQRQNAAQGYPTVGGYPTGGLDQPWNQGSDPMQQLYQQLMQQYRGGPTMGPSGQKAPEMYSQGDQQPYPAQSAGYGYAPPGSMMQHQALFYQNPQYAGSASSSGVTPAGSASGSSSQPPVIASPSFGFGSATNRRSGYGNQSSYYGGSSNPNSFGGSNFGNFYTGAGNNFPAYSGGSTQGNYSNPSQNRSTTGGFAAGRTGRPAGFTF